MVAVLAAAGCQDGSPGSASATPPPSSDAQIRTIGQQYSQCVRDHGLPNYPDLVDDGGHLTLPNDGNADANRQALRDRQDILDACKSILDKLPANAQKQPQLSDQDRQNLLKFAQCMRQNGVPEWPDPRANGSFPILGTPLQSETEAKSARIVNAERACRQYWDQPFSVK
jgi:hypothetical protein